MSAHDAGHLDPHERRHLNGSPSSIALIIAGLIVLVLAYVLTHFSHDGPRRFWLAYVQNFAFFLSLSLGGLFFVLLHHVTRAGWSVVVRRPAEIIAANLLVLAPLFVPIAVLVVSGTGLVYPWARPVSELQHHEAPAHAANPASPDAAFQLAAFGEGGVNQGQAESHGTPEATTALDVDSPADHGAHGAADHEAEAGGGHEAALILEKRAYLNPPFFVIRWILYFAVWVGLAWWFWKRSLRQDESGDVALTLSMQNVSAPAVLAFGLTLTLASFDLLMSLDPVWFSTIYGVYFFAGSAIGFFALVIVFIALLQRRGLLTSSVNAEHYHDLGKFLFGFVFFWGYIAFSQYMLIWYGNIPEETGWFFRRGCATHAPNVWSYVIILLLVGHFIIPFVALLSREVKRRKNLLMFWAVWMLVLHWMDLYWLVMPQLTVSHLPLGIAELGCLVGMALIFTAGLFRWAAGRSLLPLRDPRLGESLAFRNL